ncbi:MAG TPA: hypothetical protein VGE52_14850, partial [Pirellulales bacterium]
MTTRLAAGRSRFAGAGRRASALVAAVVGLLISASLAAAQEPITPNAGAAPNRFAATNPTEASAAVERSPEQSSTSPASSPGADGLAPRLTLGAPEKESGTKSERLTAPGSWTGLFAAAVVAGGAGLCLWFLRSGGAGLGRRLPEDVLMVLGRASFA